MDLLFRALANADRRKLLFLLRAKNGQSLAALRAHLDLTRPAVAKHLRHLEKAGLVGTQWRGRNKLHFLNSGPLYRLYDEWIASFDRPEQMHRKAVDRALEMRR